MTVKLQGLSAEHSRYHHRSLDFFSMLPLPKPRVLVNSPHLPCGVEDSIFSFALAPGKKELEVHWGTGITLNSYSLDWLRIVNIALQIVRRKGKSALLREERRGGSKPGRVRYDTAS